MHVYTVADGGRLQAALTRLGVRSKLIGTLPSNHDIDIVIDRESLPKDHPPVNWLIKVLKARKAFPTDMGSCFFLSSIYGHVDVFWTDPEMCPKCGAKVR